MRKHVIKVVLFAAALAMMPALPAMRVQAVSENDADKDKDEKTEEEIMKEESAAAKHQLYRYYDNLMLLNDDLSEEDKKKLKEIMENGKKLINDAYRVSDLSTYVSETKGLMDAYINKVIEEIPTSTSEFLVIGDNAPVSQAKYGEQVTVIVPIYNMGSEWIDDVTVTPTMSGSVKEWPFEIEKTGYSERITEIPGSTNKEETWLNHREIHYTFTTREDVLSGYYKLEFNVLYSRNNKSETAKLYTFVKTEGAPGSGSTDGEEEESGKSSTPRIVVTGFETNPQEVYAGDTFLLTIHVKNTSKRTAVSNIQIDLEAAKEGKDEDTLYAAFLPTSGSNSAYIDTIPVGGTADMNIEMTAKADLVQKPYALNVKMQYEDEKYNPYTAETSVSIPVKQEAKFDMSTPEVMPASIYVGGQSNVMFSIYNTGKTTLYNVQVKFKGDSISGGEAFVGKLEAGGTGNVDTMLDGVAPTMDDGKIKAIISYEDDAGNVTEQEKEIELFVMEEALMDPGMEGMYGEDMEPLEEEGGSKGLVIGIVAAVVVVVIVVIVILKVRKKRKQAKELAEDLFDLNDETGDKKE
ncbi:MAG: hypothetical protein GX234_03965 [Clostridiales bacterium]|nr:hypothetical protein [Clostridiales bacterium]